jgi:2-keto-4-pentenoate hydratase
MSLTAPERTIAADLLRDAAKTRTPVAPLTERFVDIDAADAYEIQLLNVARRVAESETIEGHKVGLSSKAMQRMLGVHEPDYGHLLSGMFSSDGEVISGSTFLQPRVEIELAFVLGQPLVGPGRTIADVARATEYVVPAIEIVDSRIQDWAVRLPDTIADNASSGGVVLGGLPRRLPDIDVKLTGGVLRADGRVLETGASGAVLGNPMTAVAWLANKVAAFGVALEPGHVVLPGSFTKMIAVTSGDAIRAEFEGMGYVSVAFD